MLQAGGTYTQLCALNQPVMHQADLLSALFSSVHALQVVQQCSRKVRMTQMLMQMLEGRVLGLFFYPCHAGDAIFLQQE